MHVITALAEIAAIADNNESENGRFRIFLREMDSSLLDEIVHRLNDEVSQEIDCTQCGNCCKSLMINITQPEVDELALNLGMEAAVVKEKYVEESAQGLMIMNTIPCNFLTGTVCSIYQHRFTECRDFPHLHKPNFSARFTGTLMYYGMCPIIFNVVEQLKQSLEFPGPVNDNLIGAKQ